MQRFFFRQKDAGGGICAKARCTESCVLGAIGCKAESEGSFSVEAVLLAPPPSFRPGRERGKTASPFPRGGTKEEEGTLG